MLAQKALAAGGLGYGVWGLGYGVWGTRSGSMESGLWALGVWGYVSQGQEMHSDVISAKKNL